MDDITTRLINLPYSVPGLTTVDENGEPMVYLNARLTTHQHKRTYDHELRHILHDDLHNDEPLELVETRAQTTSKQSDPQPPPPAPAISSPPPLPRRRKAAKKTPIIQTPTQSQLSVEEIVALTIDRAQEHEKDFLRGLFGKRATSTDEALVRAWLLFGLSARDPRWEAILDAYAYNGTLKPPGGRRAGESNIKPLTPKMKKLLHAIFDKVDVPRPGE